MIYIDEDGNKWEDVYMLTNNDTIHIRSIQSEPKDKLKELRNSLDGRSKVYLKDFTDLIEILIEERRNTDE